MVADDATLVALECLWLVFGSAFCSGDFLRTFDLRFVAVPFFVGLVLVASPASGDESFREPDEAELQFLREIRPVLAEKCLPCHGDPNQKLRGELDLRDRARALRGGESGEPSIVPGKPDASPLYVAVTRSDSDLEMPPKRNDRLSESQVAAIRRWIERGATWPDDARVDAIRKRSKAWKAYVSDPEGEAVRVETSGGTSSEWEERLYETDALWAFRPLRDVSGEGEPITSASIDEFIERRLREAKIGSAPETDRRTWLRRVCFGLTGLPPSDAELEQFASDDSPDAFAKVVDRLLASPRFGERFAQHWLDVARYADTAGYANDWERPQAWRYRDYVVRAFSEDKDYASFVSEQVAGDELPDGDRSERLVAAGFLRMGPWEHTAMSVALVTRHLWLDDVTNSVSEVFLGHPLRCARCHDHKFDPIPTRDYYRVQAAFVSTDFADANARHVSGENVLEAKKRNQRVTHQMAGKNIVPLMKLEGDNALGRVTKKLAAYRTRARQRFAPKALSVKSTPRKGGASILEGGSLERRGEEVTPGALSAVATLAGLDAELPATGQGRRRALAEWIVSTENPLTHRVYVNRVWQWLFGRGIVATPSNFGKTGERPTHPELLDELAGSFVREGLSTKALVRRLALTSTYRRSSRHPKPAALERADPNARLFATFAPRRLTAEELRDAMLVSSGELRTQAGGPGVFPEIDWEVALQPRHIMGGIAPVYRPSLRPEERHRRTLYVFRYRGLSDPLLTTFDRPGPDLSCERRDEATIAPQALALMNGEFSHGRAAALAASVARSEKDLAAQVEALFRRVYGRSASVEERRASMAHVERMREIRRTTKDQRPVVEIPEAVDREMVAEQTGQLFRWREKLALEGFVRDLSASELSPSERALADLALVLLNSSEFVYVY